MPFRRIATLAAVTLASTVLTFAQDIRQERVTFTPGASSATLQGTITGYQAVDYVLGAKAGQTMTVTMKTAHGANYFNVLPPGSEAAIANGSTLGNTWSGTLPVDGDYRIRVYLMRSAARRGEKAAYTLTVGITGHAAQAPAGDAKVAGTPYHATGTVPCSVGTDPKGSAQCSFGVIRQGNGRAEVHVAELGFDVKLHKDRIRVLRFTPNSVTSTDPAEKVTFERRGDNWDVVVRGFYYYTIPDAVIVGG